MSILLTGACGYIGSHIAVELLEQNFSVIIVDNLSNSSHEIINTINKITITTSNLPIGDIVILNDHNEEQLIIERKSISDLAASIKDGRYAEQSFRLNNYKLHNHIYPNAHES